MTLKAEDIQDTAELTTLLNGTVRLIQPQKGFRAGTDTVLLAAFCPAKAGDNILDLGCGVGGAGLCVKARVPDMSALYGIEVEAIYAELAAQNYSANHCDPHNVHLRDVRERLTELENTCDQVLCNPPYMPADTHLRSPDVAKARAMGQGQGDASLQDWVKAALYYLKPRGSLTLVQRADMMDEMITLLKGAFGAIEVLPLFSKATSPHAKRVLIRACKGRKSPMTLHRPLVVHEENGDYTTELNKVLRHKASLPLELIMSGDQSA